MTGYADVHRAHLLLGVAGEEGGWGKALYDLSGAKLAKTLSCTVTVPKMPGNGRGSQPVVKSC